MVKMMTFGEFLKECIEKRNLSVANLTKESGVNRGKLYYVFDDKRKLTVDELDAIIDGAGIAGAEAERLIDLFFREKFGDDEFERVKCLENALKRENCAVKPCPLPPCKDSVVGAINDRDALADAVVYLFANDEDIITNYSFLDKKIDETVFSCVMNGGEKKLAAHIMLFSNENAGTDNIETIFASLKFLYNGFFPLYRHADIVRMKYMNMFPYWFVGRKYAVLYGDGKGIVIDDPDAVRTVYAAALTETEKCVPFGVHNDDIMFIKDIHAKKDGKYGCIRLNMSSIPCLGGFADYEFIYNVAKEELPDREMLAKIAYRYYDDIFTDSVKITSCGGMRRFAETGLVQEIPAALVNAASVADRVRLLKTLIEAVNDGRLFLTDDEKFEMCPGLAVAVHAKGIFLSGADCTKEPIFEVEKFIVDIEDIGLVKTFGELGEYIIRSGKVFSKEYAASFTEELVIELESRLQSHG